MAALAQDGLLIPPWFAQRRTHDASLSVTAQLWCGIPMAIIATCVPFAYLDDAISVGILIAFNMTNTSLILMKCQDKNRPGHGGTTRLALAQHLVFFHIVAFASAMLPRFWDDSATKGTTTSIVPVHAILQILVVGGYMTFIHLQATLQPYFGAHLLMHDESDHRSLHGDIDAPSRFETPMVPFVPLLGIALNWYLIAQLEWSGLLVLFVYLGTVTMAYGLWHWYFRSSTTRRSSGALYYDSVHEHDSNEEAEEVHELEVIQPKLQPGQEEDATDNTFQENGPVMLREFS